MSNGLTQLPPDLAAKVEEGLRRMAPQWGYVVAFGALFIALGALAIGMVEVATLASVFTIGCFMILTGVLEIFIGFGSRDWGRLALWVGTGLLYAIAGAITLSRPMMAAAVFTLMLGAGLLATAIVRAFLASHLPAGSPRSMAYLSALVTGLFGVVVLMGWPGDGPIVLGTILGVDLIFAGMGWLSLGLTLRARHSTSA